MNLITALVPVATTALGIATQQVAEAVHSSVSFAQLLKEQWTGGEASSGSSSSTAAQKAAADQGPDQTQRGEQVQLETLRQRVEALREAVERALLPRLTEQGIDLSEPAILIADSQGRLLEAGGHWDRGKIEQLLADDDQLGHQVRQLLQQARALREASEPGAETSDSGSYRLVADSRGVLLQVI